jgi:hypothetical protein
MAEQGTPRVLAYTIRVAIAGFALGLAYRYFFDHPSEANVANYLRSGLHGMGLAATGWGAHSYFNSHGSSWLRRRPLIVEIALRALAMTFAISMVAVALQVVLYGQRLEAAWLAAELPRITRRIGVLERSTCKNRRRSPDRRPWRPCSPSALGSCRRLALETCS